MYTTLCVFLLALGSPSAPASGEAAPSVKVAKDHIDFLIGKDLVTRYSIGEDVAKPYFWPLNAPGGVPLTRAWPMDQDAEETTDHVHQKSAWFCHGDVIPEGIEVKDKVKGVKGVDFWSEAPGHGEIACVEVGEPKAGKNHAWITTRNEWRTGKDPRRNADNPPLRLGERPSFGPRY